MNTTQSPRTGICSDSAFNYCCTGSRWDLKCVEKADTVSNLCGRDLWTKIQIPSAQPSSPTQQFLPRDFNVVAIGTPGDITGLAHVQDPVAARGTVFGNSFDLSQLRREPYAAIAGSINFCNGTVHGNVAYATSYTDTCGSGAVTYDPTTSTHTATAGSLVNWSTVFNNMLNMSLEIGAYDRQMAATKANQTVTFTGTDPEMNVFKINGDDLTGTTSYNFNVPAGSSVIVNVFPTVAPGGGFKSMTIANAGMSGNVTPGNLLWNITWTQPPTSLTVSSVSWIGSILAPNSVLSLNNDHVTGTVVALRVLGSSTEYYSSPYHVPSLPLTLAKQYIKHVVVIVQENRSFDNYFSTFPGTDANPFATNRYTCSGCTCSLNNGCTPGTAGCYSFRELTNTVDPDLPHMNPDWTADSANPIVVNGTNFNSPIDFLQHNCASGHTSTNDLQATVGFHNATEIPNYWTYARTFVLQDRLFQTVPSWSPVVHTYLVSGWNADCTSGSSCIGKIDTYYPATSNNRYLWNDITNLLKNQATWKFFLGEDWDYRCTQCGTAPLNCFKAAGSDRIAFFWNPLSDPSGSFQTVHDNNDLGNVVQLQALYTAIADPNDPGGNSVPQVSWIVPGEAVSEHGGLANADVKWGQAYVTSIINAFMSKPALWQTTAIFVNWDDWGGFYDHVVSAKAFNDDSYGFRVPGLLITPWAKVGVDHQVLSHDAYLKLIEDLFLSGKRIDKSNGASPTPLDARPHQRETSPNLGDLVNEFDFNHAPISPLNLPCSVP